ncbi:MAG: hypothetical protein HDR26_00160 [Lachnospiraceae bacterium]|nr:hypothetical protein [Lachnospiraceae bacterium]
MNVTGIGGVGGFGIDGGISAGSAGNTQTGLPIGLGMGLAMDESAMNEFGSMTEAEKEKIILEAKDARSKKEMERIINTLEPPDDIDMTGLMI